MAKTNEKIIKRNGVRPFYWKQSEWNLILEVAKERCVYWYGIDNATEFIKAYESEDNEKMSTSGFMFDDMIAEVELDFIDTDNQIVNELLYSSQNGTDNETRNSDAGIVYIGVDSNWNGHFKIGKTKSDCKTRINQTINPNYNIIYYTHTEFCSKLEKEIHESLKEYQDEINNGCTEWFHLSEQQLNKLLQDYSFISIQKKQMKKL